MPERLAVGRAENGRRECLSLQDNQISPEKTDAALPPRIHSAAGFVQQFAVLFHTSIGTHLFRQAQNVYVNHRCSTTRKASLQTSRKAFNLYRLEEANGHKTHNEPYRMLIIG